LLPSTGSTFPAPTPLVEDTRLNFQEWNFQVLLGKAKKKHFNIKTQL
jgi:hypothetical protein